MLECEKIKKIISLLLGVVIALGILDMVTKLILHGPGAITNDIIGLILTVVFFIFLYKGHNWTRILNAYILLLGGAAGFYLISVNSRKFVSIEIIERIISSTVYLVAGILLLSSQNIKRYFK